MEKDPPGNLHGSSHIGTEGTFRVCLLGLANIAEPRAIWNALNPIARLGRREDGRRDQHGSTSGPTPETANHLRQGYMEVVKHNIHTYWHGWMYTHAALGQ